MKRLTLSDWSSVAEIIGTSGVIISLFFVIQSINLNTKAIQASNDNFIYQLQDAHLGEIIANPEFANITKNALEGKELTELDQFMWAMYLNRFLNMWELMYTRHEDGLMPDDNWETWNRSAIGTFEQLVPQSHWEELRPFAHPGFRNHVDRIAAAKAGT